MTATTSTQPALGVTAVDRRPFLGLFVAQVLSVFGNSLTSIAIPWFVLETTGSVARTGLVAAASVVPMILAMAFGSAAVDRFGFRRMSVISDALSMVTVAAIPLAYLTVGLNLPSLLVLIFLGALFDAPGQTARTALLPDLADRAGVSLERANGLSQGVIGLATLAGPVAGGLLIALVGASNVLWFNAATFALSMAAIVALVPSVPRAQVQAVRSRYLDEVIEGWQFVLRDPLIRRIMVTGTVINFVTTPVFSVLLPALVAFSFDDARVLGYLIGGFGLGNLLGIGLYSWAGERLPRLPLLLIGIGCFATGLAAFGFDLPWPVLVAVLTVTGLISAPINPIVFTAIQERVATEFLGRVMGAVFAAAMLAAPVGLLVSAALVAAIGLRQGFIVSAALLAVVTVWMGVSPALRELDRPSAGHDPVDQAVVEGSVTRRG